MKKLIIALGFLLVIGVVVAETIHFSGATYDTVSGLWTATSASNVNYTTTNSKTLTNDNNPVALFEVAIANNSYSGGTVEANIECTDGTNYQCHVTTFKWAAISKVATVTSTPNDYNEFTESSSGTLADVWTITNGTGKITINVAATPSLTETSKVIKFVIINPRGNVITLL